MVTAATIMTMKRFCERLKEARKAAGFSSQEKFAELLGMKRTQYLLYETGEKIPDLDTTVPRLANGLGLPDELVKAWVRMDCASDGELKYLYSELEKQLAELKEEERQAYGQ